MRVHILFCASLDAPFSSSIVVAHVSALLLYCYYLLFFFCPLGFCWAFSISAFFLFPSFHVPFFFVFRCWQKHYMTVWKLHRVRLFLLVFFVSCFCTLKKKRPFPSLFCFSWYLFFFSFVFSVHDLSCSFFFTFFFHPSTKNRELTCLPCPALDPLRLNQLIKIKQTHTHTHTRIPSSTRSKRRCERGMEARMCVCVCMCDGN